MTDETSEASRASLERRAVSDRFRDAAFGIFQHWGIHRATEPHAWYARKMYLQFPDDDPEGADCCELQVRNFGHPSEFSVTDFLPHGTAEYGDPEALVGPFATVGERYIIALAMHHDNFDNLESRFQPWNSVNFGPRQDVLGEWKRACEPSGLRLRASDHSARAWQWKAPAHLANSSEPLKSVTYDGRLIAADGAGTWWEDYDPLDLYLPPRLESDPEPERWKVLCTRRVQRMLRDYEPDLLYLDLDILPHDAVITVKNPPSTDAIVFDAEKGRFKDLNDFVWQYDITLNNDWFYNSGQKLPVTSTQVIQSLIDIVSMNGNVRSRPDGTLPDDQRDALLGASEWLVANGGAIFETRPWTIFGEGNFNETSLELRSLAFGSVHEARPVAAARILADGAELDFKHSPAVLVTQLASQERAPAGVPVEICPSSSP